jgi:hypothetical protein
MYDFTNANVAWMAANVRNVDMIAWYGTGSPDVQWSQADRALFPHANMLEIDQGFTGSPVPTAAIRDVENGAWAAGAAVDRSNWHVPRPTIYGGRDAIRQVVSDGWRGDVWLAAPGTNPASAPVIPGVNVVAVQDQWQAKFDKSVVFDDTWYPSVVTPPVSGTFSVTVTGRHADLFIPGVAGSDHYDIIYDPGPRGVAFVIGRPPAHIDGTGFFMNGVLVPGSHGGAIKLQAIVKSVPHVVGTIQLP